MTKGDLPLDWNEWRAQWEAWQDRLGPQMPWSERGKGFPTERNVLADEILGYWRINGRDVELSEVRFNMGALPERGVRGIGITFAVGQGDAVIAWSFSELEQLLGLSTTQSEEDQ